MEDLIIGQKAGLGIIELNRPEKLNSLNLSMIQKMTQILEQWEKDSSVSRVLIKGKGSKAFCAGGDIVALYEIMKSSKHPKVNFFKHEYALDYKIHCYKKPLVVFGHGLTMGGGLGVLSGAKYRVVTQSSKLAMPEIAIGLFPDVGATYFLNRLPSPWGYLMGMTGMMVKGLWAQNLGLADYCVSDQELNSIEKELADCEDITSLLESYQYKAQESEFKEFEAIHKEVSLLDFDSLEAFDELARNYKGHEHLEASFKNYLKGSPTSAAVIDVQLKKGAKLSLEEAFDKEARMAECFMRQHDFQEGIRALLIDKDKKPRWRPSSLDQVSPPLIDSHFS